MRIDVSDGLIACRKGTYKIGGIEVSRMWGLIRLDGISSKRGKFLNAGMGMDTTSARDLGHALLAFAEAEKEER